MKPASVKELKSALESTPPSRLLEICLRLIKFKKENKELATYLLFDETDEAGYVGNVKNHLSELFQDVSRTNIYFAKKTLRKIVRLSAKFIRYSGEAGTEAEVWLHVAEEFAALKLPLHKNAALQNMYNSVLKKIQKVVAGMHEDLQYDYLRQLAAIDNNASKN